MKLVMRKTMIVLAFAMIGDAQAPTSEKEAMIARAKSLELNTAYVQPPGDPLAHHTAGYAKVVCSAVFITGLDPQFAAENLGYFVSPYAERRKVGKPIIDRKRKEVHITLPDGVRRTARYLGDQGCVTLAPGKNSLRFKPVRIRTKLPDAATQPWPMGNAQSAESSAVDLNIEKVKTSINAAFEVPGAQTAAVVITHKDRIVGERYADGLTITTPLESWSMGKSVIATLMGVLIKRGVYDLWQPAPIPEWSAPGDPRRAIRIADLMRMSSGLRIKAPNDPDYDPNGTYSDHQYLYTGDVNLFHYAATRPQQWPPNTVGRYRNTDPVLISYLIRLGVEKQKLDYLSFPRRALFDKLGIRTMVMETDTYGNFLTQGYELASARDWARLGNLYLQDGVWEGERILPEGFVKFVSTPAPAWLLDKQHEYGGFFWINASGRLSAPNDAFYMAGAGGQFTIIIPSHDVVVVRLGHYKGGENAYRSVNAMLKLLLEAVPGKGH
ncbi:MAG: serine hydrolase [Bryobacteraceae bacterium]